MQVTLNGASYDCRARHGDASYDQCRLLVLALIHLRNRIADEEGVPASSARIGQLLERANEACTSLEACVRQILPADAIPADAPIQAITNAAFAILDALQPDRLLPK